MLLDTLDLNCTDPFMTVSNTISDNESMGDEVTVIVESAEKGRQIKRFVERIMGCKVDVEETQDLYIIKIADHPGMVWELEEVRQLVTAISRM